MLTKISIQGFKSIHNIQDLELGQVNVFIGANGSGKSNLLEAFGFLGAAVDTSLNQHTLWERGVRLSPSTLYATSLRRSQTYILENQENDEQKANVIQFSSTHFDSKEECTLQHIIRWIDSTEEWKVSVLSSWMPLLVRQQLQQSLERLQLEIKNESPIGVSKANGRNVSELEVKVQNLLEELYSANEEGDKGEIAIFVDEFVIFSPTTPVLRGLQPDIVQLEPIGLLGGQLAEATLDILDLENETLGEIDLDEVMDLLDWASGFDITAPSRDILAAGVPTLRSLVRFKDRWMRDERNQVSGYDASEGSLYVLFMLVLALHPKVPRFFAVDNFDQALNPRLARALTKKFCDLILQSEPQKQVLLTTHNPLVLDGLDLTDDRIRLFAVDRNRSTKGATEVRRIEVSEEIVKANEGGLSLSNLWTMGRLGGVPNV